MTEEEEVEGEGRAFHRETQKMEQGAIRKSQKEGNTNRIFLGISQLIDSLGFERKTARGWAGRT